MPSAATRASPTRGIVLGAIGLMTAGCCDFADIEKFSGDPMFRHLVEKDIPSQETFRQRLDQLALTSWTPAVDGVVASLLRKVADEMRPGSKHSEKGPWNFSDGAWASCWRQAARHPSCF